MNLLYISVRCEEVHENMTYVARKLARNAVLHRNDVLCIDGRDNLLN